MEHLHHFGLSEDPFRNEPRLREFFETGSTRVALARLERGLRQARGLVVLTGEPGSGKTMLVRRLLENLEEEVFEASMIVVLNGGADAGWMLTRFAKLLGIEEPEPEREALLAQVYEQLAIIREDGRHAVLIIDDAHLLASEETLSEVCGLLKLEYEERRLFSLVLAGDDQLDAAVAGDPRLAHRVEVKVRMEPLDVEGTAAYLTHRIRLAGGTPSILESDVVSSLHRLGGGLPGRINTLHDKSSGHGIVRFDKQKQEITIECYRLQIDATNPKPQDQFPGWPRTIHVTDNYGRQAAAHLPTIRVQGAEDPVIQIVNEDTGEVVYTLRVRGTEFRPKVFDAKASYTVKVNDKTLEGMRPAASDESSIDVVF